MKDPQAKTAEQKRAGKTRAPAEQERQMRLGRRVMHENRDMLKKLADS